MSSPIRSLASVSRRECTQRRSVTSSRSSWSKKYRLYGWYWLRSSVRSNTTPSGSEEMRHCPSTISMSMVAS